MLNMAIKKRSFSVDIAKGIAIISIVLDILDLFTL